MVKVIDPSSLQQHLDDQTFAIIDPRPIVKYLAGHIPRAVNLPVTKLFDSKTLELLPDERLAESFGEAGIGETTTTILYDGYDGQGAAMLAWTLDYLGHQDVAVLSSRFEGWAAEGREVLYRPVKPQPKKFVATPNHEVRATAEDLSNRDNYRILDLRSRDEFQGRVATEVRTGHIPHALNIPWTDLIGTGNEFLKPRPELGEVLKLNRIRSSERIVTYCSYGPRAAIGYVALQSVGYKVKVYDGSFHQWAQHRELPVEGEGLQLQL